MSEYIGKRYRIVKLIGKGGMADVYLAYDTILKREVAVKVLKSDMSDDPVALERFKREAGAVTKLSHPNIVDVYDVGDDGDKHYIVMEYVKGYTLKQLIKKRGPIPYKEAVWMMKQLAGALMEAHRNNVIHRDVKSQNVLIKDDGTIKLSDFGIAMASGAMQITHKDSILGSVHYLAPEISKGKQASMQSDIYSLGIVFYELLTGDVPFKADNPVQVALKHVKENIPSVRSFDPNIPQSVENIILKATAKNVNERYKNIALMIQDLNECLKRARRNEPRAQIRNIPERKSNENV
ncbi:MAG: serine/threonine protein kinase, partial [Erysipelotrichaceae bacterium]|nr:serine/threonine protein kinase [Erysipelotrichaceae bacterium]